MNNFISKNETKIFAAVLFVFTLARFFLLGKGAFGLTDEGRYIRAYNGFTCLVQSFDIRCFFSEIIINVCTAGNQSLGMIPASIQYLLEQSIGLNHLSPVSMIIPQFFNLIAVTLSAWLFFRICKYLSKGDAPVSLLATIVYLSLVNTNLYVRHILPYDIAILFIFITINYVITYFSEKDATVKQFFIAGLLSIFTFSVYPGYYFFLPLIFTLICFYNLKSLFTKDYFIKMIAFFMGFFALVVVYEIMGRIARTSFIAGLIQTSGTITQGDFDEGFTFLPEYFTRVEGVSGISLMAFTFAAFLLIVIRLFKTKFNPNKLEVLELIILMGIFGALLHGVFSYNLKKLVWYGRLVHFYVPFLVFSVIYVLQSIRIDKLRLAISGVMILVSLSSFARFFVEYNNQIAYPLNVLFDLRINTAEIKQENNQSSILSLTPSEGQTKFVNDQEFYAANQNFCLLNAGVFWPDLAESNLHNEVDFGKLYTMIFNKPHYNAYVPYQFEGYDRAQRAIMDKYPVNISVFERNAVKINMELLNR